MATERLAPSQANASILETLNNFGNAQGSIQTTVNSYGQAFAAIQTISYMFGQAQAYIFVGHILKKLSTSDRSALIVIISDKLLKTQVIH